MRALFTEHSTIAELYSLMIASKPEERKAKIKEAAIQIIPGLINLKYSNPEIFESIIELVAQIEDIEKLINILLIFGTVAAGIKQMIAYVARDKGQSGNAWDQTWVYFVDFLNDFVNSTQHS